MKVLSAWSVRPGTVREAVNRFLAGAGAPPAGVTLLGRWHKVDTSGGFSLYETGDLSLIYAIAAEWTEFLEIHSHVVLEDSEAAPILAKTFAR
jgi:hypothetical protein